MTIYMFILTFIIRAAIDIFFNESTYTIDENSGHVQPVLVLSNPSSTDINVRVTDNEDTATGELD